MHSDSNHGGKSSRSDQERRKGIAWTEEEHRLFLMGLERCGKGDWKSISRNFVLSRTPTQVASHAQKYFIRLNSVNKERRRSSIHDITSLDNGGTSAPQGPITGGQLSGAAVGVPGGSGKQLPSVLSRTPTQVASPAQKLFFGLNSGNKERRPSSIPDITSLDDGRASAPQGPITGQLSGAAAGLSGGSGKPLPSMLSRTPTQVASPAQKYFFGFDSGNKERRQSSIHDITSLDHGGASAPQGPITGQLSGAAAGLSGGSGKPLPSVLSRTPTQVASPAQKYFFGFNSGNKERRQSIIHEITSLDDGGASAPQGPITGQLSGAAAGLSGGCGKPVPSVLSRTPTQVASPAQKYFFGFNSGNKERRQSSIHDINSLDDGGASAPQGPITGQLNGAAAGLSGGSGKALLSHAPDVGVHVPPIIDRSIHRSLISAVGTPVNLPYLEQIVCGVGASTPGSLVPATPTNEAPMTLDSFIRSNVPSNLDWFHF
ncbi:hypothetical protein F0562_006735 [Nyssa sinensis]|uniref:Uncharacterized protein n=1 Tax=Nyssa sinensis TaxID=561372 RepID=A0A5J5AMC5_9ASTE|nr:hypothetical protein F0562_006735 [Nyssa sinensis]